MSKKVKLKSGIEIEDCRDLSMGIFISRDIDSKYMSLGYSSDGNFYISMIGKRIFDYQYDEFQKEFDKYKLAVEEANEIFKI